MTLEFILYSSAAGKGLSERDMWDIVYRSVRNNEQEGITGFLHHADDHFLQYLEGPAEALQWRVDRISDDPRHSDFKVIAMGPLKQRLFPDWDMGLIDPKTIPKRRLFFRRNWRQALHEMEPEAILRAMTRHAGKVAPLSFGDRIPQATLFPERELTAFAGRRRLPRL